jgi:hypothetical protein
MSDTYKCDVCGEEYYRGDVCCPDPIRPGFVQRTQIGSSGPTAEMAGHGITQSGSFGPAAEMAARARDAECAPQAPVCRGPISPLPEDRTARKATPVWSGVLEYFPAAICAAARISKIGNDIHNPGEPLHHARGKSMDHTDCIARHLIDFQALKTHVDVSGGWATCETDTTTAEEHLGNLVWRTMAYAQEQLEEMGRAPLPPRARKAAGK